MNTDTRFLQPRENGELVEARTDQERVYFIRPSLPARIVNRLYGWITGIGFGRPNSYLLQVSGRKTGKIRSVPINVLSYNGNLFLVALRDHAKWPRTARVNRNIPLKRGRRRTDLRLRAVLNTENPKILKAALNRSRRPWGRFFPLPASAPSSAFAPIAA